MAAIPVRSPQQTQAEFDSVSFLMGFAPPAAASGTSLVHDLIHAPLTQPQNDVPAPAPSPQDAGPVSSEQAAAYSPARPDADSLVVSDQADSEAWLQVGAPAAHTEFWLAKKAIDEAADAVGDEQAGLLAQAMESLRRALRKLADQLFPPDSSGVATSSFGETVKAHDRAYINRLCLALDQADLPAGRKRLERAELDDFHRRFYSLNSRLADNVHGDGEYEECKSLYLDAWRVVRTCRLYLPPMGS
jgi:hypothetical protein